MKPEDEITKCFEILKKLYEHAPKTRDAYFKLILALAVVWDQDRPTPHLQMGEHVLPYEAVICERYDYYKNLFKTKKAKCSYAKMSEADLILVVDIPVPISEMEWALKNCTGSASGWGKNYNKIVYDTARFKRSQRDPSQAGCVGCLSYKWSYLS